jgi:hypothetical protein
MSLFTVQSALKWARSNETSQEPGAAATTCSSHDVQQLLRIWCWPAMDILYGILERRVKNTTGHVVHGVMHVIARQNLRACHRQMWHSITTYAA